MNEQAPNVWMKGYLPDGRQVSITATPGSDVNALVSLALSLSAAMTAANITVNLPGLEPGENKEQIVTVMRREKPADGTIIIDFYPAWGDGGDEPFGTYKYFHKYLNSPDEIAAFLEVSGFKNIEAIPLYDGQSPLKRTKGRAHPKETAVPTPFFVVKKQGDEKIGSDGQPYRPWELVRYEKSSNGTHPAPPTAPAQPTPSQNGNHAENENTPAKSVPGQAAITWPSAESLKIILNRLQGDTGILEMSMSEFARLAGVENADDLDEWKSKHATGSAAYKAAMAAFEAQQPKAKPAADEYHATVTEAAYHKNGSTAYLEFRAPGMPRTYGRTTTFREMVGNEYYDANGFEAMERADKLGKPQTIAPLEIWWERKISYNPDGSVKADYMLVTKAQPVTKETKTRQKAS